MSEIIKFKDATDFIESDLKNVVVPQGYVKINLSTKGKVSNAPASLFARAMTSAEVLSLSMYIRDELQGPLIGILDGIIYKDEDNPVSSVAEWTPEEVIEFTIKYYGNFFGQKLQDIDYIPTQEELDWLKEQKRDTDIKALESGIWKPKITLDLKDVNDLPLPGGISRRVIIKHEKDKDFSIGFRFPYYGDLLLIHETLKNIENMEDKPDTTVLITLLSNALLIEKIKDTYVTKMTPKEKLDMVLKDPKFSMAMFDKVGEKFNEVKFGIDENIKIVSPITQKSITRRFQFRVVDVLSAFTVFKDDGYVVRFE